MGFNDQPSTRTLTARDAAFAQLRASLRAFAGGDWASAVTLAGAAEGRCPETHLATLWTLLKDVFGVDEANRVRNWMKHGDRSKPDTLVVRRQDVIMIIGRAITRYERAFGEEGGLIVDVDDLLKEYEEAIGVSPGEGR